MLRRFVSSGHPDSRHLLRGAARRVSQRRRGSRSRRRRIRPRGIDKSIYCRKIIRGRRTKYGLLDEPHRFHRPGARGVQSHRPYARLSLRRDGKRIAKDLCGAISPGGRPHPGRHANIEEFFVPYLRLQGRLEHDRICRQNHRGTAAENRRQKSHLRPFGRRGLHGSVGDGSPGRRQKPDLHIYRPRLIAQRRGRQGRGNLPLAF